MAEDFRPPQGAGATRPGPVPVVRPLRAAGRLLRAGGVVLSGLWTVYVRFPGWDAAQRHRAIARWSQRMLAALGVRRLQGTGQGAEASADAAPGPSSSAPHDAGAAGALDARGMLLVANHVNWLDILAIHAVLPQARFISKATVKGWPVLSRLVDAADTLYLERGRARDAARVVAQVAALLREGHCVAVFPEGTTSDGRGLLPFHSNMLQAAVQAGAPVLPVALRYADARNAVSRNAEFVGDTTMLQSLWWLAASEGLSVQVQPLPPLPAEPQADRRALAHRARAQIAHALKATPGGLMTEPPRAHAAEDASVAGSA